MTTKEFADRLNGREYGNECTKAEAADAKRFGFIVAFGYSDDNLELRGVAHDEIGAYDGTKVTVTRDGDVLNEDGQAEIDNLIRKGWTPPSGIGKPITIEAVWSPKDPRASWLIKTDAPHSTFDIMEDGALFCRGVVIDTKA